MSEINVFSVGDIVSYPRHGVGLVENIEGLMVGGMNVDLYVIFFARKKMMLRIPLNTTNELRSISTEEELVDVFTILKSESRKTKLPWTRCAQDYEQKMSSGSLKQIAEIVRDLHMDADNGKTTGCCYSEVVMYEDALSYVAEELSFVRKLSMKEAKDLLIDILDSARDKCNVL